MDYFLDGDLALHKSYYRIYARNIQRSFIMTKAFEIRPLGPALGAEIIGLNITQELDQETVQGLYNAWRDHIVLLFNKIDMISNDEINEKIDVFNKKIKKKIYTISAIKHKGLTTIKKVLVNYVH